MDLSAFNLQGKVALITGGAHGIGFSIAEGMAKCGAVICFNCSSEASLEKGMAAYKAAGIDAHGYVADVSDEAAVNAMVAKIKAEVGSVDILVNNAGITRDGLLMKMSEEDFDAVLNTNLKGAFNCMRHVARQMVKQRGGRIINISSVSGVMGNAGQVNYSASKAGIIGMTKSAARELASRGITVNAVAPGFVNTEMTEVLSDSVKEAATAQIPLKTFGETKDIAYAVAFLASDEARYITGQVLCVDGGMAM